jgi:hypothetical protein
MTGGALSDGRLADNVMHFARVLRTAGVAVGTDRILLAYDALRVAGIGAREDFRAVLGTCFVDRAEHRNMFDQAFDLFWKDPDLLGRLLQSQLPPVKARIGAPAPAENRRLEEALKTGAPSPPAADDAERIEFDMALTWTDRERLSKADFDSMTTAEWDSAKRLLPRIEPWIARRPTRRMHRALRGERIDLAQMAREAARHGGEFARLAFRKRRTRPEPIVILVDISGSMSRYSRMFLHFLHALSTGRRAADYRIHSFVFGTRLTHITRQLAARDPDVALAAVVDAVDDWSGGTRIAQALHEFNLRWARRVLAGSPTVLLVTDGLEHGDAQLLAREAERLSKSCRRLLWLNPLLRYDGFEPRAGGIRALYPHCDRLIPVHNLESLEALAQALTRSPTEAYRWK